MELLQSLMKTEQDGRDKQDEVNPANPRESLFIGTVHDFINTVTYSRDKPGRPGKGAGGLAGGERSEPPEYCNKRMRPGGALGAPATPAGVRLVVSLQPGGSLRSPPA